MNEYKNGLAFEDNLLKEIIKSQLNELIKLDVIDNSIVYVNSISIKNTKYNTPKFFSMNKFSNEKYNKSNNSYKLGIYTTSN